MIKCAPYVISRNFRIKITLFLENTHSSYFQKSSTKIHLPPPSYRQHTRHIPAPCGEVLFGTRWVLSSSSVCDARGGGRAQLMSHGIAFYIKCINAICMVHLYTNSIYIIVAIWNRFKYKRKSEESFKKEFWFLVHEFRTWILWATSNLTQPAKDFILPWIISILYEHLTHWCSLNRAAFLYVLVSYKKKRRHNSFSGYGRWR